MTRKLILALLLATGLVLADEAPETGQSAAGGQEQAKKNDSRGKAEAAPEKQAASEKQAGAKSGETAGGKSEAEPPPAEKAQEAGEQTKGGEEAAAKTEGEKPQEQSGPKLISGMSILGNQEAPKSLVIVPWKSSEIGDSVGITTMLDDSRQPVDKEVFMRALLYYQIRSKPTP